ncbi:hypothetical protein CR513_23308, partial [Mucuna pruriens]
MAQALTSTMVSLGTLNPPIVHSSELEWGNNNGAGVYNRSVSLITFLSRQDIDHSKVTADESVPARSIAYN